MLMTPGRVPQLLCHELTASPPLAVDWHHQTPVLISCVSTKLLGSVAEIQDRQTQRGEREQEKIIIEDTKIQEQEKIIIEDKKIQEQEKIIIEDKKIQEQEKIIIGLDVGNNHVPSSKTSPAQVGQELADLKQAIFLAKEVPSSVAAAIGIAGFMSWSNLTMRSTG
ncbi:hypothetical protein GUITHDRAFT_148276 [Guillardia theta CCMP2712]|uniref:Uncharacterized protein n=1 Tax=Guillardia theta (strain CCMP2712) TaxID=905079 RepID=L1I9K1_GUITC|nr:hypothetical protein GUITHDRAFT_148276 [Guillardia theta CCMP2712]EKX32926.1 hypothetical protein GUITHDRAFT_148276 [Guillardia theta CCMP2712]|eukprot:XP_005819906.1 hypothetical protein GUITHDRAFT_148276 [Guillardia theta CCMP2712]